jgi:hypothetical protein
MTGQLHCKASEANTSLKTVSCETGPGTTLTYSLEIYKRILLVSLTGERVGMRPN